VTDDMEWLREEHSHQCDCGDGVPHCDQDMEDLPCRISRLFAVVDAARAVLVANGVNLETREADHAASVLIRALDVL